MLAEINYKNVNTKVQKTVIGVWLELFKRLLVDRQPEAFQVGGNMMCEMIVCWFELFQDYYAVRIDFLFKNICNSHENKPLFKWF